MCCLFDMQVRTCLDVIGYKYSSRFLRATSANSKRPPHVYASLWKQTTCTLITVKPVLDVHALGKARVVGNEMVVTQKRLCHYVPSLFWSRFGGGEWRSSNPREVPLYSCRIDDQTMGHFYYLYTLANPDGGVPGACPPFGWCAKKLNKRIFGNFCVKIIVIHTEHVGIFQNEIFNVKMGRLSYKKG